MQLEIFSKVSSSKKRALTLKLAQAFESGYLFISVSKICLVPFEDLAKLHLSFHRIHNAAIISLQKCFSSSSQLTANVLVRNISTLIIIIII